jgi:DNA invertase Pin-like site-specific DNA recombinase
VRADGVGRDLTAQRDALLGLGVEAARNYVDHGLTGTNRGRPGLREALAACRVGDTLVVSRTRRRPAHGSTMDGLLTQRGAG